MNTTYSQNSYMIMEFTPLPIFRLVLCLFLLVGSSPIMAQTYICGYPDIQDKYPPRTNILSRTHHYETGSVVICNKRQQGCTRSFVYETLVSNASFAAPINQAAPVVDCQTYTVEIPILGSGGITIKTNPATYSFTNYTRNTHPLHPGKVNRQVVEQPNGDIIIHGIGTGAGDYPRPNEWGASSLWNGVDEGLRTEVQRLLAVGNTVSFTATTTGVMSTDREVNIDDLVLVDVPNLVSLGLFTRNIPASGIPTGRQQYNKPQYANLNHGVLIVKQGQSLYPCVAKPYSKALSPPDRVMLANSEQTNGIIFLAAQSGPITLELNDNETQNNSGSYEITINVVPYSVHKGRTVQSALANYLRGLNTSR